MLATRTIPDTNIVEVEFSGALRVEDEQVAAEEWLRV